MKICIFGAGAIGGYLGVQLAHAGFDVSVVARGKNLEAIRANGLTLKIGNEERTVRPRASDRPTDLGPQDFVIVALKSHQAWETAEQFKPLLGPETAVVTAQNGVPWWYFYKLPGPWENRQLESVDAGARQWRAIGPERAIGCVVFPATELIAPGVVKHVYGDKFTLGEPDGSISNRCRSLRHALLAAGLQAPIRDNIRDEIWKKLWGNLCFNPISALTQATLDIVATDPGTRALSKAMMLEAKTIGEKLGVVFRIDIEKRINGAAEVGAHRTSMLQDLLAGRGLEIDALVTSVQELGLLTETPTPYIDAVLALIQQRGRTAGLYSAAPAAASDTLRAAG